MSNKFGIIFTENKVQIPVTKQNKIYFKNISKSKISTTSKDSRYKN